MISVTELYARIEEYQRAAALLQTAGLVQPRRDILCAYGSLLRSGETLGLLSVEERRSLISAIVE